MPPTSPFITPHTLCEALDLSCVRARNSEYFVGKKSLNGDITEIPYNDIANSETYEGRQIVRSYASGHVFISSDWAQVYLTTTLRDGRTQYQFTGGSPLEETNTQVFAIQGGRVQIQRDKVEENAQIRTYNRTGVIVTSHFNDLPLVDWVLMESFDASWVPIWKLVCLMHYIVESYDGVLGFCLGVEQVVGGGWYDINTLESFEGVSPNAAIVIQKALEIIQDQ